MKFFPEPELSFQKQSKVGILLLNLGTPSAPTPEAVKPYLRAFLSDRRVVELPALLWKPILNAIILPFRAKHSAHNYQRVWLQEGSPLRVFTERQCEGLRTRLPTQVYIECAMSYGEPVISNIIAKLKANGVGRLLVIPLFPQYAGSSSGAALDKVFQTLTNQRNQMSVRTVSRFYDYPAYIKALATQIRNYRAANGSGDMLLLSFHGIPQAQSRKGDPYPNECQHTAQLLAAELGLTETEYTVSFQSRFGHSKWLSPSTETMLKELPRKHKIRKLDVICPGFVSDCIETMEEIAITGRETFFEAGGEQFHYIPCLNDNPDWLDAIADLCKENLHGWLDYNL